MNDIQGMVYRDEDCTGSLSGTDFGIKALGSMIFVTYDVNGTVVATTAVSDDGTYIFADIIPTVPREESAIRLEFGGVPCWLKPSKKGANSFTTVSSMVQRRHLLILV